jgi:hypothetical protein
MAQITPMTAIADRPQFRDGRQAGVVQFRGVVEEPHHFTRRFHVLAGPLQVGLQDAVMGHLGAIHEAIMALSSLGEPNLLGQVPPG